MFDQLKVADYNNNQHILQQSMFSYRVLDRRLKHSIMRPLMFVAYGHMRTNERQSKCSALFQVQRPNELLDYFGNTLDI
jgi:hypothetical protein